MMLLVYHLVDVITSLRLRAQVPIGLIKTKLTLWFKMGSILLSKQNNKTEGPSSCLLCSLSLGLSEAISEDKP